VGFGVRVGVGELLRRGVRCVVVTAGGAVVAWWRGFGDFVC
jgi:hypothetical protein